jgi:hypothetical protein
VLSIVFFFNVMLIRVFSLALSFALKSASGELQKCYYHSVPRDKEPTKGIDAKRIVIVCGDGKEKCLQRIMDEKPIRVPAMCLFPTSMALLSRESNKASFSAERFS